MFSRSGFYSHMRHVHEGIERIKYDKVSFNLHLADKVSFNLHLASALTS